MSGEQRIRAFLFCLSLFIFIIGSPVILSFALGYKFNPRAMKFTRTGLVFLKSQPQGARVYLDGKLLNQKTPATIDELLPGEYNVRLEIEEYYPWQAAVKVEAGKVLRLENIILFALRRDIAKLNKENITSFWIDDKKAKIYYFDYKERVFYRSNLAGDDFVKVASLSKDFGRPLGWKLSCDRAKIAVFNASQIAILHLESDNPFMKKEDDIVNNYEDIAIRDVFWHSRNYHLVVLTKKDLRIQEIAGAENSVVLSELKKPSPQCYYDENNDDIYFLDQEPAPDGRVYENVYKIGLGERFFDLEGIIKQKIEWKRIKQREY